MLHLRVALKSLAVYLLLVGIPLAALAAILRAGGRLHAPPPVAGEWRVDVPGFPVDGAGGEAPPRALTVSQSGAHLSVAFAGRELRGTLEGDSLAVASHEVRFTPPRCFRGDLEVRARVDTAARPERMSGTVGVPGACADLPFTAVRRVRAARGGR